jgi:transglutaminase-like putative cysteine protease
VLDEHPGVADYRGWSADPYLRATAVIDWTRPEVLSQARRLSEDLDDPIDIARRCFEWVRDKIPHTMDAGHDAVTYRASEVLREQTGFCFAKSHLLVALLRANGIRAGFAYQRLALDGPGRSFSLHGLVAVDLPGYGWYRVDPRGNKPGVDAQFVPPSERLAFPVSQIGEVTFPKVYADPVTPVARALERHYSASVLAICLPDALTEYELEH